MSEPKFTPGPWYVDGTFVTNDEDLDICSMGDIAWEANAHLIAAAPDLYEALEALYDITIRMMLNIPNSGFEPNSPLGKCEAALKKARGESHD